MSTRSGRSSVCLRLPTLAGSYVTYHDPSASRPSTLAWWFWRCPRISRSDPRVNGFEALHDGGCREPPDAFRRTSSEADAQVSIIQQPGHGFGELVFIAGGHKKSVFPIHDHVDYSAGCRCDHRTAAGHGLQYGRRTGIKANRRKHRKKATAKRGHDVLVWPLSAHLGALGKVCRCVWRASADQQQSRTFRAERLVGSQQRRQALISGQLANKKEELLLRQSRWDVFGLTLSRITGAAQDDLVKDEIRYNAGVRATRDMVAAGDSVAHADHVVDGPVLPWAHQRRGGRGQWSHGQVHSER